MAESPDCHRAMLRTAHMAQDTDMDSLRDDPRYEVITALMKGKRER